MEYYFQNKWWSESGGDSKKCKQLSVSDILAKIFENRDLPEICLHDFQVNGSLFGNRDHLKIAKYRFSGEGGVLVMKNRFLLYQ